MDLQKSWIQEQCDLVAKKVNYVLGCIIKSEDWSWAHNWSTASRSQFWVSKYKKEINMLEQVQDNHGAKAQHKQRLRALA